MILNLEHVQKQYGTFRLDCSLCVKEGSVTGLIGANGAGKSTIFKAILGLIRTDGGTIGVFGKEQGRLDVREKERIGVVLSDSTFSGALTIRDICSMMQAMYHNFHRERFLEQCARYGLAYDKKVRDFSAGMKAKLKLISAMSYDAELLLLDEPTAGLDVVTRDELIQEMREYMCREGRAILISSHISADLERLCDDLYFIQNGSVLFHEDMDVVLSDYAVLKVNETQYRDLDKDYILYSRKEEFGYALLTGERQYYLDNYPDIVVEKGNIDDMVLMVSKGEKNERIIDKGFSLLYAGSKNAGGLSCHSNLFCISAERGLASLYGCVYDDRVWDAGAEYDFHG